MPESGPRGGNGRVGAALLAVLLLLIGQCLFWALATGALFDGDDSLSGLEFPVLLHATDQDQSGSRPASGWVIAETRLIVRMPCLRFSVQGRAPPLA